MAISLSDFVVLIKSDVIPIRCQVGVIQLQTSNPRLICNYGVIITLGLEKRGFIGKMGFLAVIDGCWFAPEISYLAYCRSVEVYWEDLRMEAPFPGYYFSAGSVEGVAADVFMVHCRRLDGIGHDFLAPTFSLLLRSVCTGRPLKGHVR